LYAFNINVANPSKKTDDRATNAALGKPFVNRGEILITGLRVKLVLTDEEDREEYVSVVKFGIGK